MKFEKIAAFAAAAFGALLVASCCCTSDSRTPELPPLPQFRDLDSQPAPAPAPAPRVIREK